MTNRYFVDTPIKSGKVTLDGGEAHHLIQVMRAVPGTRVVLFDGSGAEFTAQVERVGRGEAELTILSREQVDRELPLELTLGTALPKGDRKRWLVEKAVELGVSRLVPLATARSVARAGRKTLARLRRTVIEASKQCGRNRLMEITETQTWPDFVADSQTARYRLLAHREAKTSRPASGTPEQQPGDCPAAGDCPDFREAKMGLSPSETVRQVGASDAAVLAVGPEGGFTADEVSLATASGWQVIDLGPRTLRTETAAIVLACVVIRDVLGR